MLASEIMKTFTTEKNLTKTNEYDQPSHQHDES